jgi:hypothetical protein
MNKVISKIRALYRYYISFNIRCYYYYNFFKQVKQTKGEKGNVLIYSGIGLMYITPIEILLYHLLSLKGYNVVYCIYDDNIEINELLTHKVRNKSRFWRANVKKSIRLLKFSRVNFSYIQIDGKIENLLESNTFESLDEVFQFKIGDYNVGSTVKSVISRYYQSSDMAEYDLQVAIDFLRVCLINYREIERLNKKYSFDVVLFSHGIYCTWEPVRVFCEIESVRYISYDRAKRLGTCNFNINQAAPDWRFEVGWNNIKSEILTTQQETLVDQCLSDRELQKGDVYRYNTVARLHNTDDLRSRLGINKNDKVITVFTNLIWDAANFAREIAFDSVMHCITETIRYYKNQDNVKILLRVHPAEFKIGTRDSYIDRVLSIFDLKEYKNVIYIPKDLEVNSFSIIDITDVGVVNTSTIGLELAVLGKPCVVISSTHYRSKGFTLDANNIDEYFQMINSYLSGNSLSKDKIDLARRYFYFMMQEYQKDMPVKVGKNGHILRYTYKNFSELASNDDEFLNLLVGDIGNIAEMKDFLLVGNE